MRELLPLLAGGDLEGSLLPEAQNHVETCGACRESLLDYGLQGMLLKVAAQGAEGPSIWASLRDRLHPHPPSEIDLGGEA